MSLIQSKINPLFWATSTFGTCTPDKASSTLCNPVGGNADTIQGFFSNTLIYVSSIIGLVAIVMIVYAGVRMLIANGEEKSISEAKRTITYTIGGFVVAVMAYALVVALENFLGVKDITQNDTIQNPLKSGDLKTFVNTILVAVLQISGLIALFMIILNGFRYMSSRGDQKKVEAAKKGLTWSLIGLAVILFAYVIISAVARFIG